MRAETLAVLDKIRRIELLRKCGEPMDVGAKVAKSRVEALRRIGSSWSTFQLMLNNRRYTTLAKISYPHFQSWNPVGAEVRPHVQEVCARALSGFSWSADEKTEFTKSIIWDLGSILLEVEFSDVMPPLFCVAHVLPVYEAGHLPCGWTGPKIDEVWAGASDDEVPKGQVVVF